MIGWWLFSPCLGIWTQVWGAGYILIPDLTPGLSREWVCLVTRPQCRQCKIIISTSIIDLAELFTCSEIAENRSHRALVILTVQYPAKSVGNLLRGSVYPFMAVDPHNVPFINCPALDTKHVCKILSIKPLRSKAISCQFSQNITMYIKCFFHVRITVALNLLLF